MLVISYASYAIFLNKVFFCIALLQLLFIYLYKHFVKEACKILKPEFPRMQPELLFVLLVKRKEKKDCGKTVANNSGV